MNTLLGLDYPTWWFLAVGCMFLFFAVLEGFDFGAGAWHLFLGGEKERQVGINAIGPVWGGNEVWLIIAGASLFAGFPILYATLFSAMYIPFMLFLVFIIFRAMSIEFRGKEEMAWWRKSWDIAYSVSSIMLVFLLGVVLGNVLQGLPIGPDFAYQGKGFFVFLKIFPLLVGLSTLFLAMAHGALYLLLKTEEQLHHKLASFVKIGFILFVVTFGITSLYTWFLMPHLTDALRANPILFTIPLAAVLCLINIPRLTLKKKYLSAFMFSSLSILLWLALGAIEVFPTLLLSTLGEAYSLTIYNAASSEKTLGIMLTMAAIGFPLVIVYTIFVYRTFRGKVKLDQSSY